MIARLLRSPRLNCNTILVLVTSFWTLCCNVTFFRHMLEDYPPSFENIAFIVAVGVLFTIGAMLLLLPFCFRRTIKPILTVLLLGSALTAYFVDSYNVLINDEMIVNVLSTNVAEAADLFSPTLLLYLLLLGILPCWMLWRVTIPRRSLKAALWSRLKLLGVLSLVTLMLYVLFSATFSSFFREHKPLRYYYIPGNYVIGIGRYIRNALRDTGRPVMPIGEDARISESDTDRELIIMVVGETARADRFSLNGYARQTNPLLQKQQVVSFSNFTSCGTATAISVPCMFSHESIDSFDVGEAKHTENALDILRRAGVNVLWRDNNSSSKGVADRVQYQDYKDPEMNPVCDDTECRDEGMLVGLEDYIHAHPKGDILIVLHQMGSHGPAYYKRYPKEFERFTPVCETNELSECSEEAISNTYDNTILYTDYFLNKTIEFLKQFDDRFETAMLYVSDHGESLGEYGVYLHGMPNFMAPEAQRHVPVIFWIGKNFDEISFDALKAKQDQPFTHNHIFHTLLSLMEVESEIHDQHRGLLGD